MPLFRPVLYQGRHKRRDYFEGWYFKQVNPAGLAWSFIVGVSANKDGSQRRSFIQAIEGVSARTWWFEFPHAAFMANRNSLELELEGNRFSAQGLSLNLSNAEISLRAELRYGALCGFPARPWRPGIMGPYSFVPAMECNHGLVSLDHSVSGSILLNGATIAMDGGHGYIEKDWGTSMPSSWIWTQCNSFGEPGNSLMFSLAHIPWRGRSFPGFLCAFRLDGSGQSTKPVVWATWNHTKIVRRELDDRRVFLELRHGRESLELSLERGRGGLLLAPVAGAMERRIAEAVDAGMRVRWLRDGRCLYEGTGRPAGLELVGTMEQLGF